MPGWLQKIRRAMLKYDSSQRQRLFRGAGALEDEQYDKRTSYTDIQYLKSCTMNKLILKKNDSALPLHYLPQTRHTRQYHPSHL